MIPDPSEVVPSERLLAAGDGWRVVDVVCTAGPGDRPFEERRAFMSVAAVVSGLFTHAGSRGRTLMPAGSLLLGNAGECYCCSHRQARGDRCVAFQYRPETVEALAGLRKGAPSAFSGPRLAAAPAVAPLVDRARRLASGEGDAEALAVDLLAFALDGATEGAEADPTAADERRVGRAVAFLIAHHAEPLGLDRLAAEAGLSRWHFLRLFRRLTGTTPYRYLTAHRLAVAARCLDDGPVRVIDVALECGFGDLSDFTKIFHKFYGRPPAAYRNRAK